MAQKEGPEARLDEIARALRGGEIPPSTTVRSFLAWFFGSQRRGHWIVSYIRGALAGAGLSTEPDFESAYLDAPMRFRLVEEPGGLPAQAPRVEVADAITVSDHAQVQIISAAFADPTYRVSKLAAANRTPVSVQPDATRPSPQL